MTIQKLQLDKTASGHDAEVQMLERLGLADLKKKEGRTEEVIDTVSMYKKADVLSGISGGMLGAVGGAEAAGLFTDSAIVKLLASAGGGIAGAIAGNKAGDYILKDNAGDDFRRGYAAVNLGTAGAAGAYAASKYLMGGGAASNAIAAALGAAAGGAGGWLAYNKRKPLNTSKLSDLEKEHIALANNAYADVEDLKGDDLKDTVIKIGDTIYVGNNDKVIGNPFLLHTDDKNKLELGDRNFVRDINGKLVKRTGKLTRDDKSGNIYFEYEGDDGKPTKVLQYTAHKSLPDQYSKYKFVNRLEANPTYKQLLEAGLNKRQAQEFLQGNQFLKHMYSTTHTSDEGFQIFNRRELEDKGYSDLLPYYDVYKRMSDHYNGKEGGDYWKNPRNWPFPGERRGVDGTMADLGDTMANRMPYWLGNAYIKANNLIGRNPPPTEVDNVNDYGTVGIGGAVIADAAFNRARVMRSALRGAARTAVNTPLFTLYRSGIEYRQLQKALSDGTYTGMFGNTPNGAKIREQMMARLKELQANGADKYPDWLIPTRKLNDKAIRDRVIRFSNDYDASLNQAAQPGPSRAFAKFTENLNNLNATDAIKSQSQALYQIFNGKMTDSDVKSLSAFSSEDLAKKIKNAETASELFNKRIGNAFGGEFDSNLVPNNLKDKFVRYMFDHPEIDPKAMLDQADDIFKTTIDNAKGVKRLGLKLFGNSDGVLRNLLDGVTPPTTAAVPKVTPKPVPEATPKPQPTGVSRTFKPGDKITFKDVVYTIDADRTFTDNTGTKYKFDAEGRAVKVPQSEQPPIRINPDNIKDPGSPNTPDPKAQPTVDPEVKPTEQIKAQSAVAENKGKWTTEAPKTQNTGGKGGPAPEPQPTDGIQPENTTDKSPNPARSAMDTDLEKHRKALVEFRIEEDKLFDAYDKGTISYDEALDRQRKLESQLSKMETDIVEKYRSPDGSDRTIKDRLRDSYKSVDASRNTGNSPTTQRNTPAPDIRMPSADAIKRIHAENAAVAKVTIDGKRFTSIGDGKLKGDDGKVYTIDSRSGKITGPDGKVIKGSNITIDGRRVKNLAGLAALLIGMSAGFSGYLTPAETLNL